MPAAAAPARCTSTWTVHWSLGLPLYGLLSLTFSNSRPAVPAAGEPCQNGPASNQSPLPKRATRQYAVPWGIGAAGSALCPGQPSGPCVPERNTPDQTWPSAWIVTWSPGLTEGPVSTRPPPGPSNTWNSRFETFSPTAD